MPACLRTSSTTAGVPSRRASERGSSIAVHHMTDVADANRAAADVGDDDPRRNPADRSTRPMRAQRKLARALVDAAAGDFDVLRGQRGAHLLDVQVVGIQLLAIEPDLDLTLRVRRRTAPGRRR